MSTQEEIQAVETAASTRTSLIAPILIGFLGFFLGVALTLAVAWASLSYVEGVKSYVAKAFGLRTEVPATEYKNPFSKESFTPADEEYPNPFEGVGGEEEYTNPFEGMEEEYINPFENL